MRATATGLFEDHVDGAALAQRREPDAGFVGVDGLELAPSLAVADRLGDHVAPARFTAPLGRAHLSALPGQQPRVDPQRPLAHAGTDDQARQAVYAALEAVELGSELRVERGVGVRHRAPEQLVLARE